MDCVKIGNLIAKLRKEKKLTQRNIADALGIQNKTVSKWECGLGCPDLSLWPELSTILGVDSAALTSNTDIEATVAKITMLLKIDNIRFFIFYPFLFKLISPYFY